MYLGLRQNGTHTAEGEDAGPLLQWTCEGQRSWDPPGILCGRWGLAILFVVGHILNLFAKPFFGGLVCVTP